MPGVRVHAHAGLRRCHVLRTSGRLGGRPAAGRLEAVLSGVFRWATSAAAFQSGGAIALLLVARLWWAAGLVGGVVSSVAQAIAAACERLVTASWR